MDEKLITLIQRFSNSPKNFYLKDCRDKCLKTMMELQLACDAPHPARLKTSTTNKPNQRPPQHILILSASCLTM